MCAAPIRSVESADKPIMSLLLAARKRLRRKRHVWEFLSADKNFYQHQQIPSETRILCHFRENMGEKKEKSRVCLRGVIVSGCRPRCSMTAVTRPRGVSGRVFPLSPCTSLRPRADSSLRYVSAAPLPPSLSRRTLADT